MEVSVEVAHQYALDVVNGKILSGKYTQLACQRHLDDLKKQDTKRFPYFYDEEEGQIILDFFSVLRHSKGEWAGEPVILEPWQQFIFAVPFGWQRSEDYTRRFRTVYDEVARKNGKSTITSGTGLYGLTTDDEPGAEIYCAATKKDQARIIHAEAVRMRDASPEISAEVGYVKDNLHLIGTASKFEPLSSEHKTQDGLNPHYGLIDEVHAHKDNGVYNVIETGMGSRRQPLMWVITTAGFNKKGFGYSLHNYARKILQKSLTNESFFAIIYSIDADDDWRDPKVFIKANPNLGVSVKESFLMDMLVKAREMPTQEVEFKCKHLNLWTDAEILWLPMEKWEQCAGDVNLDELAGVECYGGLDLGITRDVSALALVFKTDPIKIYVRYYVPEDTVDERTKKDSVPYRQWVNEERIIATPGNVTDYNYIKRDIKELFKKFRIKNIAYDRFYATQLVNDLTDEGVPMTEFGQGYISMNTPMRELERRVLSGTIHHGDDPVLKWMASNIVAKMDEAGNIKPDKRKSQEKIDGIVAVLMALGLHIADKDAANVYEDRGFLEL